ncbi:MAG: putative DNA binding domain-containing protein [Bacteroidales bacterium]|nr:putative DNA binding domain-containing protein [Bacteroidales bacterium]
MITPSRIQYLVNQGEGYKVDFKSTVPAKVRELSEEVCSFANAHGGYIFIGVDDKGMIVGCDISNSRRSAITDTCSEISPQVEFELYNVEIADKTVWVIDIPEGKDKPYICGGSVYVRQGPNAQKLRTRNEILNFFRECNSVHYDDTPAYNVDLIQEIDPENFDYFCRMAKISRTIPDRQILENLCCYDERTSYPKAGAVMFFAKHPEQHYQQCWVHCVLFKGTDNIYIIDDKRLNGTLFQQYKQAIDWLMQKIEMRIIVEDAGPHKEIFELPIDALREAMINALCHRDYYESGATIVVAVYDDRVEISNPGGLLPQVAENFGHKSLSRNPFIFKLFTRMQLVEKVGSGIPRMIRLMKDSGHKEPVFEKDGIFSITFPKNNAKSTETITTEKDYGKRTGNASDHTTINTENQDINHNTTTTPKNNKTTTEKILKYIKDNPTITMSELANKTELTEDGIYFHIKQLKKKGIIIRSGGRKHGYWIVLNNQQ